MLLADICDISQRENTEKPKLWGVGDSGSGRTPDYDANPTHVGSGIGLRGALSEGILAVVQAVSAIPSPHLFG